ncbi:MAG: hypothetical protein HFE77_02495 [Clostridiales bacterium]|nr:hypothetical protein [Clostridiales bacterium]
MKKVTVLMLVVAVMISVFAVSSSANRSMESYGVIPKVSSLSVTIDGQKDLAYDYGICLPIAQGFQDRPAPANLSGYLWLVYDDNNLYVFVEVNDPGVFDAASNFHICSECGKQLRVEAKCEHVTEDTQDAHNIWDDDCIEFMIDWTNKASLASQYRVNRLGWATRDWDTWNTGFTASASAGSNGTWYGEFSIPLDNSKLGTQIGISCMLHSQESLDPFEENIAMLNNSYGYQDVWRSEYYDYIELGPEADTSVEPPSTVRPTGGPVVNPGNPGDPGNPGNPGDPSNPKTADPIVMIVIAAFAALGAAVVIKKTCFNK